MGRGGVGFLAMSGFTLPSVGCSHCRPSRCRSTVAGRSLDGRSTWERCHSPPVPSDDFLRRLTDVVPPGRVPVSPRRSRALRTCPALRVGSCVHERFGAATSQPGPAGLGVLVRPGVALRDAAGAPSAVRPTSVDSRDARRSPLGRCLACDRPAQQGTGRRAPVGGETRTGRAGGPWSVPTRVPARCDSSPRSQRPACGDRGEQGTIAFRHFRANSLRATRCVVRAPSVPTSEFAERWRNLAAVGRPGGRS